MATTMTSVTSTLSSTGSQGAKDTTTAVPEDNNSGGSSPESSSTTVKRRPRRSYNCGPCKRQKIKCDTQIPCGACKRHNRIDQCLKAPPNPPSPEHKRKVRRISIQELSDTINSSQNNANHSNLSTSTPASTDPQSGNLKLPPLQFYTSSFRVNGEEPQVKSSETSPPSLDQESLTRKMEEHSIRNHESQIPKLRENFHSQDKNQRQGKGALLRPLTSSVDENQSMRNHIVYLNERIAILESRMEQMTHQNTLKLSVDDHIFEYLSTIPHHVSLENSNGQKTINIKFLAPDKLNNWDDFIQNLPEEFVLSKIKHYFATYLNSPVDIISQRDLSSCFNRDILASKGKAKISNNDWENLSLVAIICSLTILNYPLQYLESDLKIKKSNLIYISNTLFQISKNCLNTLKFRESPKLIHLQILILCHKYLQYFNKKDLLITTNSEMVSIAYALGLQTLSVPQNSLETEHSQKIWWFICLNDTLLSLKFGIPPLIRTDILPNTQARESHILKAFIPAEVSSFNSMIKSIAKITKLINDIPATLSMNAVERTEKLIVIDRQLTSAQMQSSFRVLPSNKYAIKAFQSFYLYSICVFSRFKIYENLYFNSHDASVWLVLASIIESFFKKYNELRRLHPVKDSPSFFTTIAEHLVSGLIKSLMVLIIDPEVLPDEYKVIIDSFFDGVYEDLMTLKTLVLNESLPFYTHALSTLKRMKALATEKRLKPLPVYPSVQEHQTKVSTVLKESRVLESEESEMGLLPTNEFFNRFLSGVYQSQYEANQQAPSTSWNLPGTLDDDQVMFLNCIGIN